MDEGAPSSYLLLARDTPVYCCDGVVAGTVKEVLSDPGRDIFDGLVVATAEGDRSIAADRVTEIHELGVHVDLASTELRRLPLPPVHRTVRYDLSADAGHTWAEVMHWLHDHLARIAHPSDRRLARAHERLADRERARKLAREDPRLALEAGVGRPDLPGSLHGGLIDVNNAPPEVIATLPGVDPRLAARIVAAREQIEGFSSVEDLGSVLDLPAADVEHLRDHAVCLPR